MTFAAPVVSFIRIPEPDLFARNSSTHIRQEGYGSFVPYSALRHSDSLASHRPLTSRPELRLCTQKRDSRTFSGRAQPNRSLRFPTSRNVATSNSFGFQRTHVVHLGHEGGTQRHLAPLVLGDNRTSSRKNTSTQPRCEKL